MPSAQVQFPDVSYETQECSRKVKAEGTITVEQSAIIAAENAARLEECANKIDSLRRIIADYLELTK